MNFTSSVFLQMNCTPGHLLGLQASRGMRRTGGGQAEVFNAYRMCVHSVLTGAPPGPRRRFRLLHSSAGAAVKVNAAELMQ